MTIKLFNLIQAGLLKVNDVLVYQQDTAVLQADGSIYSETMNASFESASAWATASARWGRSVKTAVNGWNLVSIQNGYKLEKYRVDYKKMVDSKKQTESSPPAAALSPPYSSPPRNQHYSSPTSSLAEPFLISPPFSSSPPSVVPVVQMPPSPSSSRTLTMPSPPILKPNTTSKRKSLPADGVVPQLPKKKKDLKVKDEEHEHIKNSRKNDEPPAVLKKTKVERTAAVKKSKTTEPTVTAVATRVENDHVHNLLSVVVDLTATKHIEICVSCTSFVTNRSCAVYCSHCGECYHSFCIYEGFSLGVQESLERGWRCMNCIICERCREPQPDHLLLVCDKCDRGYHTTCLQKPLDRIPEGTWLCESCACCRNCGATSADDWTHGYTLCAPCGALKDKGNICPVCQGLYADDYNGPMVQCDGCDSWVHTPCVNLNDEDYNALSEPDQVYYCPRCIATNKVDPSLFQGFPDEINGIRWKELQYDAKIDVLDRKGVWCAAKVVKRDDRDSVSRFLIHYLGWPKHYDEWLTVEDCLGRMRAPTSKAAANQNDYNQMLLDAKPLSKTVATSSGLGRGQVLKSIIDKAKDAMHCKDLTPPPDDVKVTRSIVDDGIILPAVSVHIEDVRSCQLCRQSESPQSSRLIFIAELNEWGHVNCILWSSEVYESEEGELVNAMAAISRGKHLKCQHCSRVGATIGCCVSSCKANFHFPCAKASASVFMFDKQMFCANHANKATTGTQLKYDDLALVDRRLYVRGGLFDVDYNSNRRARCGAATLVSSGEICIPHSLQEDRRRLIPVGYEVSRIFWSCRNACARTRYTCRVVSLDPALFEIVPEDAPDLKFSSPTLEGVWSQLQRVIDLLRQQHGLSCLSMHSSFPSVFFGLDVAAFVCASERLPGSANLVRLGYQARFIKREDMQWKKTDVIAPQIIEQPSGCSRSEPIISKKVNPESKFKFLVGHVTAASVEDGMDMSSGIAAKDASSNNNNNNNSMNNGRNFMSAQTGYRQMRAAAKSSIRVGASRIHAKGLFATKPFEKGDMIIEYVGEIIGQKVADKRERQNDKKGLGTYMFRLAYDLIIDATYAGNAARFINHCCEPNCFARTMNIEGSKRVIIFADRRIEAEEELTYDYKFAEENEKIVCMCGATSCKGTMN